MTTTNGIPKVIIMLLTLATSEPLGLSAHNDQITVDLTKKPQAAKVTCLGIDKPPNADNDKITVSGPSGVKVKRARVDDALFDGAAFVIKSDTVVEVVGRGGIGAMYIIEATRSGEVGTGGVRMRSFDEWWGKAKDWAWNEVLVLQDKNGSGSGSVRTDLDANGPPPPSDLCVYAVGAGEDKRGTLRYWISRPDPGVIYKGRIYTTAGVAQGAEENLTKDGGKQETNVVEKGGLALGDYYVLIKKNNIGFRRINFSVLWVDISFKMTANDDVKGVVENPPGTRLNDNNKKDKYRAERQPPSYICGPGIFQPGPCWGVLTVGEVHPTTFTKDITIERHVQARWYLKKANNPWQGIGRWSPILKNWGNEGVPPGNDTGPPDFSQDRDPQSDDSAGHIYDWDAPGLPVSGPGQSWATGDICRVRANFTTLASYNGNRCSEVKKSHVKLSYKKTESGWVPINDVGDDNTGTSSSHILLSEKLGHPTIDRTIPDILDKSDYADPGRTTIVLLLGGDNFVDLPTVVFKKGGTIKPITSVDPLLRGATGAFVVEIPKAVLNSMTNGAWTIEVTNVGDTTKATKVITIQD